MSLENIKLDIDYVRSQFPAFEDSTSKDWSFFENAGGSYVPKNVIDKLTNFMTATKVQPYAEYPMSKIAGNQMNEATDLFSKMIKDIYSKKKTWFDEISGYHDFIQSYMEFICFVEQQINSKN